MVLKNQRKKAPLNQTLNLQAHADLSSGFNEDLGLKRTSVLIKFVGQVDSQGLERIRACFSGSVCLTASVGTATIFE